MIPRRIGSVPISEAVRLSAEIKNDASPALPDSAPDFIDTSPALPESLPSGIFAAVKRIHQDEYGEHA